MRLIESYLHGASLGIPATIGVLVDIEANIEGKEFRESVRKLGYEIAMQIAATDPTHIGNQLVHEREEYENESDEPKDLLMQSYIKNPDKMIREIIFETEQEIGAPIKINRFVRYDISDT